MEIKVLGTGCPRCKALEKLTRDVAHELGIDAEITKVENIEDIMEYGIIRTPSLVIDGEVVISGRIPSVNELKDLLTKQ